MAKILITGGAGFIASHIADLFIAKGHDIVIVDNLSTGRRANVSDAVTFYNLDIRDAAITDVFRVEKPDYVVHHAAQASVANSTVHPTLDADTNILGTVNLLEHCQQFGVQKFIYASSAAVYGNPTRLPIMETDVLTPLSFYALSKATAESYIRMFSRSTKLKHTILRYANVYGPRQDPHGEAGVISIFVEQLRNGVPPNIFGDGSQTRDFIYVQDIAFANLLALGSGDNQTFNISTGLALRIDTLLLQLQKRTGTALQPIYAPAREGDIHHSCLDNQHAKQFLAWTPSTPLEQGLSTTVQSLQTT